MMSIQSEFSKRKKPLLVKTPIELSRLIDYFKKENKENFFSALVVGPRRHEVRFVVPAKFTAVTRKLTVLPFELSFLESKTKKNTQCHLMYFHHI